jgi:hypothetical protein
VLLTLGITKKKKANSRTPLRFIHRLIKSRGNEIQDLIDDQGESQAASKTKSKGAVQKAPGEKANRPEVTILDSEISIDESPVKAKKKRSKPSAEEAKKEMEGLKKQVKEAKTKVRLSAFCLLICHLTQRLHNRINQKRADEADLNKSATSAPHKLSESVLSRLLPPSVSMKICFLCLETLLSRHKHV